jgi:hypothetical protein
MMRRYALPLLVSLLTMSVFTSTGYADTIFRYDYPGAVYSQSVSGLYTQQEFLHMTLDFASILSMTYEQVTPLDWSLFDGVVSLSSAGCPLCQTSFMFRADANGIPHAWVISIQDPDPPKFRLSSFFSDQGDGDQLDLVSSIYGGGGAYHNNDNYWQRAWNVTVVAAPEPSCIGLLLIGFMGIGACHYRLNRRRPA